MQILKRLNFILCFCAATAMLSSAFAPKVSAAEPPTRSLLVQDDEVSKPKVKRVPAKLASSTTEGKLTPEDNMRKVPRKEVTENLSEGEGETFDLRYKFSEGTRVNSEVTHMATTYTKVDTTDQNSSSRTVSHKTWDFIKANNGEFTFEYQIVDINMSQRIGEGAELRYSSADDEEPRPQFRAAAESIGKVISTVTIDEQGLIIARSDDKNPPNLGMGDITLPLPSKPVGIGASWETPRELRIQREDGSLKQVKFRELFRLEKVSAGVATVSVRSEMITIVTDPKEEAQVLQQLSNGSIKFDIDEGRMISKNLSWDKRVVGFSGAGSVMEYSARLDEEVQGTEQFKR